MQLIPLETIDVDGFEGPRCGEASPRERAEIADTLALKERRVDPRLNLIPSRKTCWSGGINVFLFSCVT